MPLVASASRTVRNKNIILIVMCAAFAAWFGYDGFVAWPAANQSSVAKAMLNEKRIFTNDLDKLQNYRPDSNTDEMRTLLKKGGDDFPFHTDTDLLVQKLIVAGLLLATMGAVWFYFNCQKRRAILDVEAKTLSPKAGLNIPVDAISVIDNTAWKKTGIVVVTYKTPTGGTDTADLDDYKLDGLPPLLNELSTLAAQAELIPPA